jgi:hypothetical protein
MVRLILALPAALSLLLTAMNAHDYSDNGAQVPAWVKTVCCGPNDVHRVRPEQIRRNATGDYVVDIYPFPIPARMALPSPRRRLLVVFLRGLRRLWQGQVFL